MHFRILLTVYRSIRNLNEGFYKKFNEMKATFVPMSMNKHQMNAPVIWKSYKTTKCNMGKSHLDTTNTTVMVILYVTSCLKYVQHIDNSNRLLAYYLKYFYTSYLPHEYIKNTKAPKHWALRINTLWKFEINWMFELCSLTIEYWN